MISIDYLTQEEIIDEDNEICVLAENPNDLMLKWFIINLSCEDLKIWPKRIHDEDEYFLYDVNSYKKTIKNNIESSKVIVAFITNKFCNSELCVDCMNYSRNLKKPLLALLVEEIENYEKIKSTILIGCHYYCEIYKARFYSTSFDYFLWISDYFESLIGTLEELLDREIFVFNENSYEIKTLYSIDNEYSIKTIDSLVEMLQNIIYNDWGCHQINYKWLDLENMNKMSEILEKQYIPDPFYDYYEALLISNNIECKNDYLNLMQHFYNLVDRKFKELTIFENEKFCLEDDLDSTNFELRCIKDLIKFRLKINNYKIEDKNKISFIIQEIYYFIQNEFQRLNLSLDGVYFLASSLSIFNTIYYYIKNCNIVIIFLSKSFYESGKFQKIFNNLRSIEKKIFALKLDDFILDQSIFNEKVEYFGGIFDLYKHKDDGFCNGYEFRNLIRELEKENISIRCRVGLNINNDVFSVDSTDTKTISQSIKVFFEKTTVKFLLKSEIQDTNPEAVFDKIEKSRICLFFLKNDYIRSNDFMIYHEFCQKLRKFSVYIVLEKLSDSNLDINLNQINVFDWNAEELNDKFWYLISTQIHRIDKSVFNINDLCFYKAILDIDTQLCSIDIIDIPINNHLIIITGSGIVYIFDRKSFNFINTLTVDYGELKGRIHNLSYIRCLNSLCFISDDSIFSMTIDYKEIKELIKLERSFFRSKIFIVSNDEKETTYLYNLKENVTRILKGKLFEQVGKVKMENITNWVKCVEIINNSIYYLTEQDIIVFDFDLKYIGKFGMETLSNSNYFYPMKNNNYICVIDKYELKIFNLINFKYCRSVYTSKEKNWNKWETNLLCDNMIVKNYLFSRYTEHTGRYENGQSVVKILKTNFSTSNKEVSNKDLNDKYMCKINEFNHHLLFNEHELTCGNYSCLECIFESYNSCLNRFICPFESCKTDHLLKNKLIKLNLIENNLSEICINQIKYFDKKLLNLSIYFDDRLGALENRFNLIDDILELRFESLKISFDKILNQSLDQIEKLQEVFIKKTRMKNKIIFNTISFKSIKEIHIGNTDLILIQVKLADL